MDKVYCMDSCAIDLAQLFEMDAHNKKLSLFPDVISKIEKCRSYLDHSLQKNASAVYGINTGFGSLCNVKISRDNLAVLQENLVMSHACGIGEKVPAAIVKLMLLLKIRSLSYGYSGVQLDTVMRLTDFYNNDILPVVYTQGSLGASGDLAPLAHLSLPLIGKGEVVFENETVATETLLKKFKWEPVILRAKEGLALLNGTQFMSAYGIHSLLKAYRISYLADVIAGISIDAFDCKPEPFHHLIHHIRPHKGQIKTAARIMDILEGSVLMAMEKNQVQDPYSFRCIPQVHGATKDTLEFVRKTFITEINAVTDNPNIFVDEDMILSGGNFHGQPLALALDYLGIAMAELGSISERRTYQLVSGQRGLPEFLIHDPGLNSGLMIPQYTAASMVSQNKQLATPASVDSITSSNGQEDHVSMGANAAVKALQIVENTERILAIELLTAAQALEFRRPLRSSRFIEDFISSFKKAVPFVQQDRILHTDMVQALAFIKDYFIEGEVLFKQ